MIGADVRGPTRADIDHLRRYGSGTMEAAALATVKVIARRGKVAIRGGFRGAGLAGLGRAIDSNSDADKGTVYRFGKSGFSVSARFFARTRSERTLGAIESYTQGSEITPVRGRWLWIPTDQIKRFTGSGKNRRRITPKTYREQGLETKVGPLVYVRSVNGNPLLVVQGASVNEGGKSRSASARTKTGKLRKGQRAKDFIVAFVGIPRTSRAARVNITQILEKVRSRGLEATFAREIAKAQRRNTR